MVVVVVVVVVVVGKHEAEQSQPFNSVAIKTNLQICKSANLYSREGGKGVHGQLFHAGFHPGPANLKRLSHQSNAMHLRPGSNGRPLQYLRTATLCIRHSAFLNH